MVFGFTLGFRAKALHPRLYSAARIRGLRNRISAGWVIAHPQAEQSHIQGLSDRASAGRGIAHPQAEQSRVWRHCFVTPIVLSRPITFPIMPAAPITRVGAEL
jgi:hypothetical protein